MMIEKKLKIINLPYLHNIQTSACEENSIINAQNITENFNFEDKLSSMMRRTNDLSKRKCFENNMLYKDILLSTSIDHNNKASENISSFNNASNNESKNLISSFNNNYLNKNKIEKSFLSQKRKNEIDSDGFMKPLSPNIINISNIDKNSNQSQFSKSRNDDVFNSKIKYFSDNPCNKENIIMNKNTSILDKQKVIISNEIQPKKKDLFPNLSNDYSNISNDILSHKQFNDSNKIIDFDESYIKTSNKLLSNYNSQTNSNNLNNNKNFNVDSLYIQYNNLDNFRKDLNDRHILNESVNILGYRPSYIIKKYKNDEKLKNKLDIIKKLSLTLKKIPISHLKNMYNTRRREYKMNNSRKNDKNLIDIDSKNKENQVDFIDQNFKENKQQISQCLFKINDLSEKIDNKNNKENSRETNNNLALKEKQEYIYISEKNINTKKKYNKKSSRKIFTVKKCLKNCDVKEKLNVQNANSSDLINTKELEIIKSVIYTEDEVNARRLKKLFYEKKSIAQKHLFIAKKTNKNDHTINSINNINYNNPGESIISNINIFSRITEIASDKANNDTPNLTERNFTPILFSKMKHDNYEEIKNNNLFSIKKFNLEENLEFKIQNSCFSFSKIKNSNNNNKDKEITVKSNYKCDFCDKLFISKCAKGGHTKNAHRGLSSKYQYKQQTKSKRTDERRKVNLARKILLYRIMNNECDLQRNYISEINKIKKNINNGISNDRH